jgi:hypothetical protein
VVEVAVSSSSSGSSSSITRPQENYSDYIETNMHVLLGMVFVLKATFFHQWLVPEAIN